MVFVTLRRSTCSSILVCAATGYGTASRWFMTFSYHISHIVALLVFATLNTISVVQCSVKWQPGKAGVLFVKDLKLDRV